jgi:hypothetical protein
MNGRNQRSVVVALALFLLLMAIVPASAPVRKPVPRSPSGAWDLAYFLKDGKLGPRARGPAQWVHFGPDGALSLLDGCTLFRGNYALTPEGGLYADARYGTRSGCVICYRDGTGCRAFPPEGQALVLPLEASAWEVRGDQLWLYFDPERSDGVVLRWVGSIRRYRGARMRSSQSF